MGSGTWKYEKNKNYFHSKSSDSIQYLIDEISTKDYSKSSKRNKKNLIAINWF